MTFLSLCLLCVIRMQLRENVETQQTSFNFNFVVVSSDKDFAAIVVGQAWWHGKGAYCLRTK